MTVNHESAQAKDEYSRIKAQASKPATVCPIPHQIAIRVTSHWFLAGRYSKNTHVSRTRFPPAPKPVIATNAVQEMKLGDAPATIEKMAAIRRERLNAHLRPITSAPVDFVIRRFDGRR